MTLLRYLGILVGLFLIGVLALAWYVDDVISTGMPSLEQLENPTQDFTTQVISADGKLLDYFEGTNRQPLPLSEVPEDFKDGLIAVEDREFYSHWGVHSKRVVGSFIKRFMPGGIKAGASTITMQLARNLWLDHSKSLERKIRESFVSLEIEKTYTKDEILEMYINTIAMGRGAYGLKAATRVYFDKDVNELTLSEIAFLVGVIKTPAKFNGQRGMDLAYSRRNLVLAIMRNQGVISSSEYSEAREDTLLLKTGVAKKERSLFAPHFVELIRQTLSKENPFLPKDYNIHKDGLIIHTTLDSRIQKYALESAEEHLEEFQKLFDKNWNWRYNQDVLNEIITKYAQRRSDYKNGDKKKRKAIINEIRNNKKLLDSIKNLETTIQTGLTVIDPYDGKILAMVGASPKFMREHKASKYSLNHVTQIRRQPGSSFKPFVYTIALQNGMKPTDTIGSGPFEYETETGDIWSPGGSRDSAGTTVSLQEALRRSINTVAARIITREVTPLQVVTLVRKMGIKSTLIAVPAIALGAGGECTPLEMVSAYGTYPNKGLHVMPHFITKIEDRNGNVIYEKTAKKNIRDAIDNETVNTMIPMMQQVVDHGTAHRIRKYFNDIEAAGKTGTTNNNTDAWFIGYTPELVAGAWVGFDDNRITFGKYGEGGTAAAPIWGRLMAKIYADKKLPYKKDKFDLEKADSLSILMNQTFMPDSSLGGNNNGTIDSTQEPRLRPLPHRDEDN